MGEQFDWKRWNQALAEQREGKRVTAYDGPCPDCGDDPNDDSLHVAGCRRIRDRGAPDEYLQFGPPWYEDAAPADPTGRKQP